MAKDSFNHNDIDTKWQARWREDQTYKTESDSSKEKAYVLDMFPYPSGEGLHVGHPKGYIATDVYSRFQRMHGKAVLHPMGWDAFGLPAENYALKNKVHPRQAVEKNIATFKAQLEKIGFDYDWSREINTTDPAYYHWTQWIFLKLLEHNLAFRSEEPINWCPSCMTGLANEDLDQGVCERCGTPVVKKTLPQWVLKITDYADRLIADLELLPRWPEHIKESQRNWIGRSEGAKLSFALSTGGTLDVFTTRADTLYGVTYVVIAPEHPWITTALIEKSEAVTNRKEVREYIEMATQKTEIERTSEGKEKTGVEVQGVKALHPITGEELPVFVADYVLGNYGTGAVMAVPAHDERDFEFATKFSLPIKQVVAPRLVQTQEPGAFKEGEPSVVTNGIIALVEHWSEKKYLALRWKEVGWTTLMTGGIDGEEKASDTALRELREETGYTDAAVVEEYGIVDGLFYHVPKAQNRLTHGHVLRLKLQSDAQETVAQEEQDKHELVWLTETELREQLTAHTHQYALKLFFEPAQIFGGDGTLINSAEFSDRENTEAMREIIIAAKGEPTTTYRLRDWVFSRQRYWGEPIPILHCAECGIVPVPYEDLPVVLPEVEHYEPTGTGESPLAAIEEWVNTTCPRCKGAAKRETNTMPQWAGSSWYYLRFMDPHNTSQLVSGKEEKYWAPVDVYVGGAEHATRHLIYARFWHKFLYDIGVVSTAEPFAELHSVGLIIAEDGRKMSKRFGNVVNPDDVVSEYGADAFRVYEMFMGPFDNSIAWNTRGLVGARRFLDRVYKLRTRVTPEHVPALDKALHTAILKVSSDIPEFRFNTAISAMMICLNELEAAESIGRDQWEAFLIILAPFAPHLTEELWFDLGNESSIHLSKWATYNEAFLTEDSVIIGVQVAGKRRAEISLSPVATEEEAVAEALKNPLVQKALIGGAPSRVIYREGKILNLIP
jgi:leucyl-tRNA synthetase